MTLVAKFGTVHNFLLCNENCHAYYLTAGNWSALKRQQFFCALTLVQGAVRALGS